jgi:hypothetical protein
MCIMAFRLFCESLFLEFVHIIPHNFAFYFLFYTFLNIGVTIHLPHNMIHIINFAHNTVTFDTLRYDTILHM